MCQTIFLEAHTREKHVWLGSRHKSTKCKWNGKQGLKGCHAETEQRWGEGLPSQISLCRRAACQLAGCWEVLCDSLRLHWGTQSRGTLAHQSLWVSQPPVFTLTRGQGHSFHAGMTPGSFSSQSETEIPVTGPSLNKAVSRKSLHSVNVWTVTLVALCLKEEMSQLNSFGRTHKQLLIWILSLHVS